MSLSDAPDPGLRDMPLFDTPAGPPGATDPDCPGALRARLLRAGREAVDDRELLQLLLSGSHPAGDARALSGTLLDVFGSPARVLAARPDTLRAAAGLDETSIAAIKIAEALGIRLARAALPDELHPTLDGYAKVVDYCRALTGHRQVEELHILFLNSRNRLIRDERHSSGTVSHTPAYPREICVRALEVNAAALILVHDHPSGEPSPSRSDIDMTNRIRDAVKLIDVALHDHIVVTPTDAFSFREKGLL